MRRDVIFGDFRDLRLEIKVILKKIWEIFGMKIEGIRKGIG